MGGMIVFLAYLACIPVANWMIGNVGTFCVPGGPCLIPVAPGIMAPSGVLMVGFALVLRDIVQRRLGAKVALTAMVFGVMLSVVVAPPGLVLASGSAFLFSELVDFSVYTPLQRRGLILAVVASAAAGLVIDSLLFLGLAFHSLDFLAGQVIGKAWAVLLSLPVLALTRRPA